MRPLTFFRMLNIIRIHIYQVKINRIIRNNSHDFKPFGTNQIFHAFLIEIRYMVRVSKPKLPINNLVIFQMLMQQRKIIRCDDN